MICMVSTMLLFHTSLLIVKVSTQLVGPRFIFAELHAQTEGSHKLQGMR